MVIATTAADLRRCVDPEIVDQAEQVCPLQSERSRRVGAVAAVLEERRLYQLALEVDNGRAVSRTGHRRHRAAAGVGNRR